MKTAHSLFLSKDYKIYLANILEEKSKESKGQRLRLAEYLHCNPSYVSQVLNGHQDFTPEQACATSQFLGHTESESRYFLNLVLLCRAGTQDLKKYYTEELKKISDDNAVIKNRLKTKRTLGPIEQARYYKVWYNAAIHMIVSIHGYRTRERIAKALKLNLRTVNESVEFLISINLLDEVKNELIQGERSLMIGSDSPFLIRHQTNWRIRALQELDGQNPENLHFSGVITCSNHDVGVIREILLTAIQEIRSVIKDSPDETLAVYNLDLFEILPKS